jgi:hypothetical protein|tara:strand:+ start:5748 stop:6587 length:840 start_codon:yes stop_codon:yes gene_type:complete
MKKLTIGLCVYDDFDGIYFTIQSLRLHHSEVMSEVEFIIINNNPKSHLGNEIQKYTRHITEPLTYVEYSSYSSTALRDKIFTLANTPYVLVMDCHVLLEGGILKKLIDFYDNEKDNGNLLQGPLIYDDLNNLSTHYDLSKWGAYMWGTWGTDKKGEKRENKPFEIPAQGLGLFSCRKESWLGFNNKFRGFGGEEGYIHEKYRQHGKATLCLPWMRWMHRFQRPHGVPYNCDLKDRFRNYMIGFHELKLNINDVIKQFKEVIPKEYILEIKKELGIIKKK